MGAWSASVAGNDTAQDLKYEYTAAFYYYDVPEALQKIDTYVRAEGFDESDEEEWCNYVYSLADFMWKKGILTEEIKQKAIGMIDSGFGLELWAESGEKMLRDRKKALEKFRKQLLSDLPPKKKIKPNVHLEQIFDDGDLIAIQLKTAGVKYAANYQKPMSDDEFHALDGKYVLIQKIKCYSSWSSSIVPEVKDYWAVFRLFDGIYDGIPDCSDIKTLENAKFFEHPSTGILALFSCESNMFYFKRRNYRILGNYKDSIAAYLTTRFASLSFSAHHDGYNIESYFLAAMGKTVVCEPYKGTIEGLKNICRLANGYGKFDYSLSKGQNEQNRWNEETIIFANVDESLSVGSKFYGIKFGRTVGVISVLNGQINNFYVEGQYQSLGFGTTLLKYVVENSAEPLSIEIPETSKILRHICSKVDGLTVKLRQ